MPGLLSLPGELLEMIVLRCDRNECCRLRAVCRTLREYADPIVFRRIVITPSQIHPHIAGEKIIALAAGTSPACKFTRDIHVFCLGRIPASDVESFGRLDLRMHLPAALSALQNLTCFRWTLRDSDPVWLIESVFQVVARLPRLSELEIVASNANKTRLPLGIFSNLTKLTTRFGRTQDSPYFVSQISTLIANSPQLRSLDVTYWGYSSPTTPLPKLSDLLGKLSTESPLHLENLRVNFLDVTLDQTTVSHLRHLTSFDFQVRDEDFSVAQAVWTSFVANGVQLSHIVLSGIVTEEAMFYLLSFSGLRRLVIQFIQVFPASSLAHLEDIFFSRVLPKHADSLQELEVFGAWSLSGRHKGWLFDHKNSKTLMKCHKLREIFIYIDGNEDGMPVQLLLDTVGQLPELEVLRLQIQDNFEATKARLANFKPTRGIRYVKRVQFGSIWYVLEQDGWPVRYREMDVF